MREICMSGSMSGMWKRSMVRIMRHRQPKGPGTDRPDLTHRATSRLYLVLPFWSYLCIEGDPTRTPNSRGDNELIERTAKNRRSERVTSRSSRSFA
jgi:hypothetical protein